MLEGGSIGRCLALIGTSEFQKKRDEHIHFEAVVECLHTANSLHDIADLIEQGYGSIVQEYKAYVNHVCVQRYMDKNADPIEKQTSAESTWPGHRDCNRLAAIPAYFGTHPSTPLDVGALRAEGQRWQRTFHKDLDYVIEKRQEHIHMKDAKGVRQPLTACRSKDKPDKCKHGFMKDHLICPEPRLLCPALARKLELSVAGRRNAVGTLEASRGSGSVNGCIPAVTVGSGDNNDIKVPYRLPILRQTHEKCCEQRCFEKESMQSVIDAVEASQSAQVGYHCDYANKRQPLGMHEASEWVKGHQYLAAALKKETLTYATRRHAQRIVSDCFARGILRTPNETSKLNDVVGHADPTAAEVTSTAPCVTFPGEAFSLAGRATRIPEHACSGERIVASAFPT